MNTKHTPGPWEIFPAHDHCPEEDCPSFVIGPKQFHTVAQVRPGNIDDGLPAETPANARLIAASPCLLEALQCWPLQELLGMIEDSGDSAMWDRAKLFMEVRDSALAAARANFPEQ